MYTIVFIALFIAIVAILLGGEYTKILFWGTIILLIVYSGLRDPFLYPDISNYYEYFRGDMSNATEGTLGLGYLTLNRISRLISPSFFFLIMIISVIIIYYYAKTIWDYSPYIWFSLLLFILVNYYPSFFLLRQYLAMAIFLFSLKYIVQRELLKYAMCIMLAMSFHLTAIVVFPLYFLYEINFSKKNMAILLIGSILFIYFFREIGPYINRFSTYYAHYFEIESEESAWRRAIMKIYILIVYLFVMKRNSYDVGINRIIFYSMVLNVIINVAAMNIFGVFRLREYFSIADFIGVPIIIKNASSLGIIKKISSFILVLVYIVLLFISFDSFINGGNMNNLYQPFWKSEFYLKASGF